MILSGTPGTGKTIFALEFLYNGANKFAEPGVYVTLEQSPQELISQAKDFGWNLDVLQKQGKIEFVVIPVTEGEKINIFESIKKTVEKIKAKRLVIDSLSIMSIVTSSFIIPFKTAYAEKELSGTKFEYSLSRMLTGSEEKRFIYSFLNLLKDFHTTNLLITDAPYNGEYLTRDQVSEFACDGLLLLRLILVSEQQHRAR